MPKHRHTLLTTLFVALVMLALSAGIAAADKGILSAAHVDATSTPTPTPSPTPTPTPTFAPRQCHPVAFVIATFFDLKCEDVTALHDQGIGFGEIARAYLTALASDGTLTPAQVMEMRQAGMGWGNIMNQFGIQPGGNGLGAIMSGRRHKPQPTPTPGSAQGNTPAAGTSNNDTGAWPGNSGNAPGHNKGDKPAQPGKGKGPRGRP